MRAAILILATCAWTLPIHAKAPAGDDALGTQPYERFEQDSVCAECHATKTSPSLPTLTSTSVIPEAPGNGGPMKTPTACCGSTLRSKPIYPSIPKPT
jgi:hypothetical protein